MTAEERCPDWDGIDISDWLTRGRPSGVLVLVPRSVRVNESRFYQGRGADTWLLLAADGATVEAIPTGTAPDVLAREERHLPVITPRDKANIAPANPRPRKKKKQTERSRKQLLAGVLARITHRERLQQQTLARLPKEGRSVPNPTVFQDSDALVNRDTMVPGEIGSKSFTKSLRR